MKVNALFDMLTISYQISKHSMGDHVPVNR